LAQAELPRVVQSFNGRLDSAALMDTTVAAVLSPEDSREFSDNGSHGRHRSAANYYGAFIAVCRVH